MDSEAGGLPIDRDKLRARLTEAVAESGFWTDAEIDAAVNATLENCYIGTGWRWSVGISGAFHSVKGFARTQEEAEAKAQETFHSIRDANPAVGSLPTEVYRETQPQRKARLERAVADYLND